ncbi:MAG: carboxypeptidase regulatory-like domain-containing protein [Rubrivivax sp.]|nr:carboxypeptidase regulatory-like domain-containing protein [Pyrinomonadaceae bacterium]
MKRPTPVTGRVTAAILWTLVVILFITPAAFAQTGTSAVSGTVTDPQGNAVAGANITLSNEENSFTRTQTSSDSGAYTFNAVPPGTYSVEVSAPGFKKATVTNVRALVDKPTDVKVALEIGALTESVTISASAGEVLLNTQDATLGNNFVSQQITQLPLEARNVQSLLTLQPGVTREGYVTGARSDQSNITLDGVDINEAQSNDIGTPVLRLNSEAIEEFRVVTSNANATQGRSSGAQISLVTKSGSNEFHGAGFWFHRPTILTANDFFNNRAGVERPTLIRNVYGGALGGPLKKDRAFFFYSYEGRKDRSQETVVRTVPLASLGRGELRYLNPSGGITTLTTAQLNTIFPTVGINAAAVAALGSAAGRYPANDFTVGDSRADRLLNTAGFRFNASRPADYNSHAAKFDLNITERQNLFVRANVIYDLVGGVPAFPDTPSPNFWNHPFGIAVGHTWTVTNNLVNRLTYGLTRDSFTNQGDSDANAISFRFVFSPRNFTRTLSRSTPVQNITDDISWSKGDHTFNFGTNIRLIRNERTSFANSFDSAITNPSFYAGAGATQSNAVNAFSPIGPGFASAVQNSVTALIGRFSQYSARFIFDQDGSILPSGSPSERRFATEEYDLYAQDSWKLRQNLTVTYGLRYGLSRPVYETNGFETKPNIPLDEYFQRRVESAAQGRPFNDPITIELSGPANDASPLYRWDKNNFQPRVGIAWSPEFEGGVLGAVFGKNKSTVRGGFAITNDYYGQQLAVTFDLNNTLGFSSNQTISANTFNTSTRPAPQFTGFGQNVRSLERIVVPGNITFPRLTPANGAARIESSLDEGLRTPINYSWNVTFERELPAGFVVQTSYIGRMARNLLATRDVMALNNIVDPKSGIDWYTAGTQLEILRAQGVDPANVAQSPYFANLFPSNLADQLFGPGTGYNQTQAVYALGFFFYGNDWTSAQLDIDDLSLVGPNLFYQPQYAALSAFGTIAKSNYHAGTLSVRQRLGTDFLMDFNYTFSKSLDDASGLQNSGTFGAAFILNPIRQQDSYAASDFDIRHLVNINSVWQLPIGRGKWLFGDAGGVTNAVLGGWQLSGIFRWNSGLPIFSPYDDARWATNWNVQSSAVRTGPVQTCPTRGGVDAPRLFGCDQTGAYRSFRNARPGETGDRNVFRLPGYVVLDMGLSKAFTMPWSEGHKLQLRFEAFNVTNTQRMGDIDSSRTGFGITLDPATATPPTNWSNFTAIQGDRRVMQFGFRYNF